MDRTGWSLSHSASLAGSLVQFPIQIVPIMHSYLARTRHKTRFLDLGCTEGNALLDLHAEFGDSIELHGLSLRHFPGWPGITKKIKGAIQFHVGHAEALDRKFPKNYFDFIRSNLGIAHATDLGIALEKARKVLRKGGLLMISLGMPAPKSFPGFEIVRRADAFTTNVILRKK